MGDPLSLRVLVLVSFLSSLSFAVSPLAKIKVAGPTIKAVKKSGPGVVPVPIPGLRPSPIPPPEASPVPISDPVLPGPTGTPVSDGTNHRTGTDDDYWNVGDIHLPGDLFTPVECPYDGACNGDDDKIKKIKAFKDPTSTDTSIEFDCNDGRTVISGACQITPVCKLGEETQFITAAHCLLNKKRPGGLVCHATKIKFGAREYTVGAGKECTFVTNPKYDDTNVAGTRAYDNAILTCKSRPIAGLATFPLSTEKVPSPWLCFQNVTKEGTVGFNVGTVYHATAPSTGAYAIGYNTRNAAYYSGLGPGDSGAGLICPDEFNFLTVAGTLSGGGAPDGNGVLGVVNSSTHASAAFLSPLIPAYCGGTAKIACGGDKKLPDWGMRNGDCVPSCGGLGGKVAQGTPCENRGLTSAGNAYDTLFCCK